MARAGSSDATSLSGAVSEVGEGKEETQPSWVHTLQDWLHEQTCTSSPFFLLV